MDGNDGGPRAAHEARRAELAGVEAAYASRSERISSARGVTFLLAAGGGLAVWFGGLPRVLFAPAGVAAAVFLGLVIQHALLVARADEVKARRRVVERAIARLDHAWGALGDDGARFASSAHPYAVDLDVFGAASLYRLVSTARTGDGEQRIARWLLEAAAPDVVRARQVAAREIAARRAFREDLEHLTVQAGTAGKARDPLLAWAEGGAGEVPLHRRALARLGPWLTALTVLGLVVEQAAPPGTLGLARHAWALPWLAQIALLFALHDGIASALVLVGGRDAPFAAYLAVVRRIEAERFDAPALAAPRAALDGASEELGRLARVLSFAEAKHNALAHLMLNALFAWDLHTASSLSRWRSRIGPRAAAWVSAIAEIEAIASLGALAHDHPRYAFPDIVEGPPRLEARGLGHPLLAADRRVDNDVQLGGEAGPRALLITGSNMSGKSTLLRAVGVNTALALAGAPVCAEAFTVSPLHVWTSMRVTDSLDAGVSHFYAELARLKDVVAAKDRGEPVLFLLDEVMHGTNSRERQIGAKAVATHLVADAPGANHAIGALSSHDLGLGELEEESGGAVQAVHFEEQVHDGKMTFDYKMKRGVVRSGNALRLMRELGLPVPPDA